jgi:molybdopterin-guanine dinucleotide biosynthesis protein A
LAVACDMPFLSVPLLRAMHPLAVGYDAVLPLVKGRPEPLHAVYRTACAPVIDDLLLRGEHRLGMLAEALEVRYMLPDEWGLYCRDGTSFFNVNTPEDLARAESLA